jgi:transposase InsO family protein
VQKWRHRASAAGARMGPKHPRSTALTPTQEAVVVAFRRHTLLPLDDCLYALQPTIAHLTRSTLHRCLQRHGIARLPEAAAPKRGRFRPYPISYFHVDIAEVHTEEGRLSLFVAVDRTSKFAFAQLHERATRRVAAEFLEALAAAVPYRVHTVLTDNGTQFVDNTPIAAWQLEREAEEEAARAAAPPDAPQSDEPRIWRRHAFDATCQRLGVEHRLTKPAHPWTNGQVERMNRTIKDATVRRYYYDTHDQLREHLQLFLDAYNYARRLKALRGLTPYEFICKAWADEPHRFTRDPTHDTVGPNTLTDRPRATSRHANPPGSNVTSVRPRACSTRSAVSRPSRPERTATACTSRIARVTRPAPPSGWPRISRARCAFGS